MKSEYIEATGRPYRPESWLSAEPKADTGSQTTEEEAVAAFRAQHRGLQLAHRPQAVRRYHFRATRLPKDPDDRQAFGERTRQRRFVERPQRSPSRLRPSST